LATRAARREGGFAGDRSRQPAGPDEAGLVGEHDELGAVSGTELAQGPADESILGGTVSAIRPYLPYTAATTLGGAQLGAGAF
jgi:hypothetical protein